MRLTRLVDFALWVLLLFTAVRTTVGQRRRDADEFASIDSSATLAVILIGAIIGLLLVHPRARGALMRLPRSAMVFLLAYLVWASFSTLWSVEQAYTLFRAGELIAVLGALVVLMEGFANWRDAERAMLWTLLAVTVLSVLQRALQVGVSIEGLHTNQYTVTAGIGFLYTLGESLRGDPQRRIVLRRWAVAFAFFALLGTSAGSNIGIAVGMLVLLPFLSRSKVIIIPAALACVALIVVMGTSEDFLSATVLSGRSVDEATRLTGRWYLWSAYWRAFLESPWIGHGFAIIARIGQDYGGMFTTNAHNGYIEGLAGLGVVGFVLLVVHSIRLLMEAVAASRTQIAGGLGCLVAFIMLVVNNNSKSIIGGSYDPTVIGIFAMLAFFHVFTVRATRAQQGKAPVAPDDVTGQPQEAAPNLR